MPAKASFSSMPFTVIRAILTYLKPKNALPMLLLDKRTSLAVATYLYGKPLFSSAKRVKMILQTLYKDRGGFHPYSTFITHLQFPKSTSIDISLQEMKLLLSKCPELLSLTLPEWVDASDSFILSLAKFNPKLQDLDLQGCFGISDEPVPPLVNSCKNLKRVILTGTGMTGHALHILLTSCKNLDYIEFKSFTGDTLSPEQITNIKRDIQLKPQNNRVKVLNLEKAEIQETFFATNAAQFSCLTNLNLSFIQHATDSNLVQFLIRNPFLEDIRISRTPITDLTLYAIGLHNPRLKFLNISGTKVSFEACCFTIKKCIGLHDLDISACRSVLEHVASNAYIGPRGECVLSRGQMVRLASLTAKTQEAGTQTDRSLILNNSAMTPTAGLGILLNTESFVSTSSNSGAPLLQSSPLQVSPVTPSPSVGVSQRQLDSIQSPSATLSQSAPGRTKSSIRRDEALLYDGSKINGPDETFPPSPTTTRGNEEVYQGGARGFERQDETNRYMSLTKGSPQDFRGVPSPNQTGYGMQSPASPAPSNMPRGSPVRKLNLTVDKRQSYFDRAAYEQQQPPYSGNPRQQQQHQQGYAQYPPSSPNRGPGYSPTKQSEVNAGLARRSNSAHSSNSSISGQSLRSRPGSAYASPNLAAPQRRGRSASTTNGNTSSDRPGISSAGPLPQRNSSYHELPLESDRPTTRSRSRSSVNDGPSYSGSNASPPMRYTSSSNDDLDRRRSRSSSMTSRREYSTTTSSNSRIMGGPPPGQRVGRSRSNSNSSIHSEDSVNGRKYASSVTSSGGMRPAPSLNGAGGMRSSSSGTAYNRYTPIRGGGGGVVSNNGGGGMIRSTESQEFRQDAGSIERTRTHHHLNPSKSGVGWIPGGSQRYLLESDSSTEFITDGGRRYD